MRTVNGQNKGVPRDLPGKNNCQEEVARPDYHVALGKKSQKESPCPQMGLTVIDEKSQGKVVPLKMKNVQSKAGLLPQSGCKMLPYPYELMEGISLEECP